MNPCEGQLSPPSPPRSRRGRQLTHHQSPSALPGTHESARRVGTQAVKRLCDHMHLQTCPRSVCCWLLDVDAGVLCVFLCLARGQRVLLGCRAQKSLYSFARHGWCVPRCGHVSVCCHTVHTHHVPSTHRPFAVSTPPTPTSLRRQRHVLDSDLRRERRVHATVLPHGHMLGCRAPAPPLTGATESLRHQFPPPQPDLAYCRRSRLSSCWHCVRECLSPRAASPLNDPPPSALRPLAGAIAPRVATCQEARPRRGDRARAGRNAATVATNLTRRV